MANDFQTNPDLMLMRELYIENLVPMPDLITRGSFEQNFLNGKGKGDTIDVKIPVAPTVNRFTGAAVASEVSETKVPIVVDEYLYVQRPLSSKEQTLDIEDFYHQVEKPSLDELFGYVNEYFTYKTAAGFTDNIIGTVGTNPSTIKHLLNAQETLTNNKKGHYEYITLLNSAAWSNMREIPAFNSAEFGQQRPASLANHSLKKLENFTYVLNLDSGDFDYKNFTGSLTATTNSGSTSVAIQSLPSKTATDKGVIRKGTRFTVAGVTGVLTVQTQVEYSGTTATVVVDTAADASVSTAAVTIQTAYKQNVCYDKAGVVGAMIPPLGKNTTPISYKGAGFSVIHHAADKTTLADTMTYQILLACEVIQPNYGVVLQGS